MSRGKWKSGKSRPPISGRLRLSQRSMAVALRAIKLRRKWQLRPSFTEDRKQCSRLSQRNAGSNVTLPTLKLTSSRRLSRIKNRHCIVTDSVFCRWKSWQILACVGFSGNHMPQAGLPLFPDLPCGHRPSAIGHLSAPGFAPAGVELS